VHVVCEWIGNSAVIAQKHYLRVTKADYERALQGAAKSDAKALQNPVQPVFALRAKHRCTRLFPDESWGGSGVDYLVTCSTLTHLQWLRGKWPWYEARPW
jgi:hypothetical protein